MNIYKRNTMNTRSLIKAAISLSGAFAIAGCQAFAPLTDKQRASGEYSISAFDAPTPPPQNVPFVAGHGQFTPRF